MSYTVAFIDKTVITDRTDVGTNYSETNVRNAILDAQQFDLYPKLGKNLYDRFDTDINNDSYAITGNYLTNNGPYVELMEEYIVPYLREAAYVRLLDTIYLTPRNNGLGQRSGGGLTPASNAQYSLKKTQGEEKMRFYESKLLEYIRDQWSEFSELQANTELVSDRPNAISEESGSKIIYFSDNKSRIFRKYDL